MPRMGDIAHGSCRIANAIGKRLNETIKSLIETAAPRCSCGKGGRKSSGFGASQIVGSSEKCAPC